ncbi:hypothetical protein [Winogradskyella sp. UBA3174]|uniref:hypothetical protein n=1 Tax=Winogradskyella sp. UBA3174 TaxID=1947785 RepID=UPI0025D60EE2|nr:hypothetical protein [Winogradskyella sp. UBA3174]|tara:strand:+ start:71233 stop:72396 length:1164 start_codon:yes stop_codon:yes gene_type:complete
MNLIIIPFHDWRKSEAEGFRTRDVHLIRALSKLDSVDRILVINRPTTKLELIYKKLNTKLNGKIILKTNKFNLTHVDSKIYVADYISYDIIGQIKQKQSWFFNKYGNANYINFIKTCITELNIEDNNLLIQNIFSYKCAEQISSKHKLVDAWDNFLKFPVYKNFRQKIEIAYKSLSNSIPLWVTNSNENIIFYKETFGVRNLTLLKNGLNIDFASNNNTPEELQSLKRPIVGYGGKISYLINVDLINYATNHNPELSFVFVGQVLDKQVYDNIIKRDNVYFLGDKHYDVYPSYVNSFDICIVPYNINEGQHGGDSIKAYEYLSTNKKVVGTKGNGLLDLEEYIYLTDDKEIFSNELKTVINEKPRINLKDFSWSSKAERIVNLLSKE